MIKIKEIGPEYEGRQFFRGVKNDIYYCRVNIKGVNWYEVTAEGEPLYEISADKFEII